MGKFDDLVKIPNQPALRLLALVGEGLSKPVEAPATATVGQILPVLLEEKAMVDALRLMSVALPIREAIWWACLAARDQLPEGAPIPATLASAEAWVFDPAAAKKQAAESALDAAEAGDVGQRCAFAVKIADGRAGSGLLADTEMPQGSVQSIVFAVCVDSLVEVADGDPAYFELLIDRALDIARGGNGRIAWTPPETEALS